MGVRVVEELARRRDLDLSEGECNARLAGDEELIVAAPQTYMNRSGYTARCLRERRGVEPDRFLVVYDEIHLPLGTLRLRRGGSPAGHRGMESVLESLGTDRVPRLRLGVGGDDGAPPGGDWVAFVLEPFAESERERVAAMVLRAADACGVWATEGAEAAMQHFNGPPPS